MANQSKKRCRKYLLLLSQYVFSFSAIPYYGVRLKDDGRKRKRQFLTQFMIKVQIKSPKKILFRSIALKVFTKILRFWQYFLLKLGGPASTFDSIARLSWKLHFPSLLHDKKRRKFPLCFQLKNHINFSFSWCSKARINSGRRDSFLLVLPFMLFEISVALISKMILLKWQKCLW